MNEAFDDRALRRFGRTMRVALQTALAEYDVTARRGAARPVVMLRALAAKGAGGFRFPEKGVMSADGLIVATLKRASDGAPRALLLQAQGSVGLSTFAGRTVEIALGDDRLAGAFGRDGGLEVSLEGEVSEEALAAIDLILLDDAP